jgi:hypothetical protein
MKCGHARVNIMKKKRMDHTVAPGSVARPSGYTMNTRPGPEWMNEWMNG